MAGGFVVWSGAFGSAGLCTVSGGMPLLTISFFRVLFVGFVPAPGTNYRSAVPLDGSSAGLGHFRIRRTFFHRADSPGLCSYDLEDIGMISCTVRVGTWIVVSLKNEIISPTPPSPREVRTASRQFHTPPTRSR